MAQEVQEVRKNKLAWSIAEFSEATGLSAGFIRKEIRLRGIIAVHAGRRVLIPDSEIKRYLEAGSRQESSLAEGEK